MTVTTAPTTARPATVVRTIEAASHANGGGTFTKEGVSATSGYAVTVNVLDKVAGGDDRHDDLLLAIYDAVREVPEGDYIGTWFDSENGVWEVSETAVFEDREKALALARHYGERYVYDLTADECIATS